MVAFTFNVSTAATSAELVVEGELGLICGPSPCLFQSLATFRGPSPHTLYQAVELPGGGVNLIATQVLAGHWQQPQMLQMFGNGSASALFDITAVPDQHHEYYM